MKTFIKTALIAVAVLVGMSANAQEKPLTFGVKAGMSLSNFNGDLDMDAKIGFNAGVTMDYALAPDLYLLTGLDFTTKGAKDGDDFKMKLNLSYLQLPIHVGYKLNISENTRLNLHAGPYLAYAVSGKWKVKEGGVEGSIDAFGDEVDAVGLKMKRFDFGLGLGVGVEFGQFNVGLGYDLGLLNIADFGKNVEIDEEGTITVDASNFKVRNMNAYLTVGYKF
ncbi:hypothetical protein GGR21_003003 [Dysgonomonas hofstadii]|uniref:Outer membrane protein beta-barrel domain-containing protein n=1 Tax=Dysgonomonas hofstadii TaxID=637886 RepID=A0A840CSH2_9BACT|nr:porin family protein [Dysgonomonas hofstadii]MBB4037088.1 hypothetical protein [Dysgonomonas hofstadii]